MQLILDNIVATVIAASITLMLMSAQHRNQMATVESTAFYMLEQQMIDFQSFVRRDMQNLRSVETVSEIDSAFVFFAQTSPTDTTRKRVTYKRTARGVRHMPDGTTRPMYQIVRLEDGVVAGGTMSTIVDWNIAALNAEGTAIASAADAAQVAISVTALPPLDLSTIDVTIDESRWDITYHPRLLRESTL